MIIRLPGCYPLSISPSLAHWSPNGTSHKKSNPRVIAFTYVRLLPTIEGLWGTTTVEKFPKLRELPLSEGWRLWIYFRQGYAWHIDVYIDRRELMIEAKIMGDMQ